MARPEEYPAKRPDEHTNDDQQLKHDAVQAATRWLNTYQPELLAEMSEITSGKLDGAKASWLTEDPHSVVCDEDGQLDYRAVNSASKTFNEFQEMRNSLDGPEAETQAANAIMQTLSTPVARAVQESPASGPKGNDPSAGKDGQEPATAWRRINESGALALYDADAEGFADALNAMQDCIATLTAGAKA